jgi:hypothetical protein
MSVNLIILEFRNIGHKDHDSSRARKFVSIIDDWSYGVRRSLNIFMHIHIYIQYIYYFL